MSVEASNISIGQAGLANPALYVRYDGKVGIGSSSPTQTLDVNGAINAISYCNVNYTNLTNKPSYALVATSGSYADLSNIPSFATIARTGLYSDLSNIPTFASVATTGSYSSLINTPTSLTAFTNDLSTFSNRVTFGSNIVFANTVKPALGSIRIGSALVPA